MRKRYSKPNISTDTTGAARAFVRVYDVDTGALVGRKSKTLKESGKRAREREAGAWVESLKEADERAAQEAEKSDPANVARDTPLADYVSAFVDEQEAARTIEPSTVSGYRSSVKYIRELEGVTVGSLTPAAASAWEASLTARGLSSSTVGKAHRLLKQVLQHWALERDGAIAANPMNQVKPPKRKAKNPGHNILEAPERQCLLDALDGIGNSPMTIAARLGLFMGLRIGEICALQWRDVDFSSGLLNVAGAIGAGPGGEYSKATKTDRVRKPTMPAELAETLKAWKAEQAEYWRETWGVEQGRDSYVVGDPLGWGHASMIRREYNALVKVLGLVGTMGRSPRFHDLRHTWATMAIAAGSDIMAVSMYLGHAKPSMTLDVYATAAPNQIARTAALIGDTIRGDEPSEDS